jgi:hypothetical protein
MVRVVRDRLKFLAAVFVGLAPLIGLFILAKQADPAVADAASIRSVGDARTAEGRFWFTIEQSRTDAASPEEQSAKLRSLLQTLPVEEVEEFDRMFRARMNDAYSWDLWGAAYVIHGGESDDGFEYFRAWLISKGRFLFEGAVADPDSLADLVPGDARGPLEFDGISSIAPEVWAAKTGRDPAAMPSMPEAAQEPSGTPFNEDEAALARRYPKLWRRFGTHPLG